MSHDADPTTTDAGPEEDDLPTVESLAELTALVHRHPGLFVRWSRGPEADRDERSRDDLSGAALPGLCASPLDVEPWWGSRSPECWVARRLCDYRHLDEDPRVRPWLLEGEERGRGPDNEPLVESAEPVAWVDSAVVDEAVRIVESEEPDFGPLRRDGGSPIRRGR